MAKSAASLLSELRLVINSASLPSDSSSILSLPEKEGALHFNKMDYATYLQKSFCAGNHSAMHLVLQL
jgi:hypothetical protein